MFVLALTPIVLLVVLLFWFKWPLSKAAPSIFIYTLLLTWFKWDVSAYQFLGIFFKAGLLTLDVVLILFGAIFFLGFLQSANLIRPMQSTLAELTQDKRVQALLLAWLFGSFLEGIAGFGTPAAIVAPLLVSLGFGPLKAILLSLLANSTAVTFGAVGTAIRVGFASLDISGVASQAALINLLVGWLVPMMMLAVVSDSWLHFRKGLVWAIAAAVVFLIPYYFSAQFGFEFPSIFGGAVGLFIAISYLRPKHISALSLGQVFSPYLLLIGILVIGKWIFLHFSILLTMGAGLTHNLSLFNPGFAFLTVILILNRKRCLALRPLILSAALPLRNVAISIFFTCALSYLMITSGLLQTLTSVVVSKFLPFYAAGIGAFGAFLAGSATVSNLLFGEMQFLAAEQMAIDSSLVLALQLVGAGAGNMIALANILAVQAAVGVSGEEGPILKRLMLPCLIYLLLVGCIGMAMDLLRNS